MDADLKRLSALGGLTGVELIAAERQRQIESEGFNPHHDDLYERDELARAAAAYLTYSPGWTPQHGACIQDWPWDAGWFKPKDRRANLIRAGALIAAELDRMAREDAYEASAPLPGVPLDEPFKMGTPGVTQGESCMERLARYEQALNAIAERTSSDDPNRGLVDIARRALAG